jgi:hypothetical protein
MKWGCVYVIRCGSRYKIGYTWGSGAQRMRQFRVGNPQKMHLVCEIPTTTPERLERDLHSRLHAHLIHGEWFRLNMAQVKALQSDARYARAAQIRQQVDLAQQKIESGGWG